MDPQVAELLATLNAVYPRLGTDVTDADEARRLTSALRRDVPDPTPVAEVAEIAIESYDGSLLPARLYRAPDPVAQPGALVYFHGGGWVLGSLDTHDELVRRLVTTSGLSAVSVEYRLAPKYRFPVALRDTTAAVAQVRRRTSELRLEGPILVGGDSAGANLAAACCLATRADAARPDGQVLLYPVLDSRCATASFADNADGYYIGAAHLRWFWTQYLGHAVPAKADPLAAPALENDLTGLPPAVIVTAGLDPLRDEGEAYARALEEVGVAVRLITYPDAFHGFLAFASDLKLAAHGLEEVGAAIRALAIGSAIRGKTDVG